MSPMPRIALGLQLFPSRQVLVAFGRCSDVDISRAPETHELGAASLRVADTEAPLVLLAVGTRVQLEEGHARAERLVAQCFTLRYSRDFLMLAGEGI